MKTILIAYGAAITLTVLILLCGCAAPPSDQPVKDWQGELQKAIDRQKREQN